MSSRDNHGHYVNDKGVTIKVHTDKRGKDHIDFYDGPADGNHSSVHVNIDYSDGGSWTTKTHGPDHSNTDPGSGGCFLTSACMNVHSDAFDDNCHELQTLRWFRDHHVSEEDIAHYYRVAPAIVASIDRLPDNAEIYRFIYESVIRVCVSAIEARQYGLAYTTYRDAVLNLEQQYLKN